MSEKTFDDIHDIECPHCGERLCIEHGDNGLTTYWGEESVEWECPMCGEDFLIQEWVSRYYTAGKTLDEL